LSRPIMLRSRRESHHRNGITDLDPLQQTSATKSAPSGPAEIARGCLLIAANRKTFARLELFRF
jgi:hypothetical protein